MAQGNVVRTAALPAGVKRVGRTEVPLDAASIRLVMEGWEAQRILNEAQARLDAIRDELVAVHGEDCELEVTRVCRASITRRSNARISNVECLEGVLGARMLDLVEEQVSYVPKRQLLDMACDADDPLQPAIAACLEIDGGATVAWRAA